MPFAKFQTLAHSGNGPDLIVHFQEDKESQPDRYTVVEAERFFYNYKAHGHTPSQYPRVICWGIGTKAMKVDDTKKLHKKVAMADGVQVNIFCIRHMPGVSVLSRREAGKRAWIVSSKANSARAGIALTFNRSWPVGGVYLWGFAGPAPKLAVDEREFRW